MFGNPVIKSSRLPCAGTRDTRPFVPIGPLPPKLIGKGTEISPGWPDSATYNEPSAPKASCFGFTNPDAYTSTCDWLCPFCAVTVGTTRTSDAKMELTPATAVPNHIATKH